MTSIPDHIYRLLEKSLSGELTTVEKELLDEWFYAFPESGSERPAEEDEALMYWRLKQRLDALVRKEKHRVFFTWRNISRVAAVFFAVCLSIALPYFFLSSAEKTAAPVGNANVKAPDDMAPGAQKALLTLADGTTINLDSASNGTLGKQGNAVINLSDGQVRYNAGDQRYAAHVVLYNTIATPKGGQYQVTLSDRTKIWLNTSSSVRFPAIFHDSLREVAITGEAYFEVAPDKERPFIVKINNGHVMVYGTQFNVMGYANEQTTNVTLLTGSVKVENGEASRLLVPGQQARLNKTGEIDVLKEADIEEAIAWKKGKFYFNRADMRSIMRQIERWYNVEVHFEEEVNLHFTGQLNRYENVSETLRKLELTNEVHFRIEGKRITVLH